MAIGLPSPGDEAFLTGSGFFLDADDDIVFASHDPDVSVSYNSQSNPLAMGLPEIDVEKARDRGRVFILHDICWLMLFDCVADRQISRRPLLVKSLYGLLCSMPCGAEGCSLSHRAAEGLPQFVLGRRLTYLHARPGVSDSSFKNALLRGNPAALGLNFENKLVANISAMSPSLLDNTKPVNWSSDPFFFEDACGDQHTNHFLPPVLRRLPFPIRVQNSRSALSSPRPSTLLEDQI